MSRNNLEMFAKAPIPKAVLKNAIPSVISMMMTLIYNLADTFFIGQTHDPLMVAAVSLATPVFLIFMSLGVLFGVGGTSVVSRAFGADRPEYAKKTSAFCLWSAIGLGFFFMAIIFIFMDPICRSIGTSDNTIEFTRQYLGTVSLCAPVVMMNVVLSNVIRAEGRPNVAMTGMLVGNIVNIILDPIMILTFGWDVYGAAIATVIGNLAGMTCYLVYILRGKSKLSFHIKNFTMKNRIATSVLAIGIPASLANVLMSFSHIIANDMMSQYGDLAVAGVGVAMKVGLVVVLILIGFGMGVQPILGFCFGARNEARFKAVLRFSVIFATIMGTILALAAYLGSETLVRLFLDDPAALEFGTRFARVLLLSGPVLGLLFLMINAVQSMGAGSASLVLSISRQGLIYIPILFITDALFHSADWILGTQALTDYLAAALAVVVYTVTRKRMFARLEQPEKYCLEDSDD